MQLARGRELEFGEPGSFSSASCSCVLPVHVCWCSICILSVVIILGILIVGFTADVTTISEEEYYSPGDTRLIKINPLYCTAVTLTESSTSTNAQMYLLTADEIPPITNENEFKVEYIAYTIPRKQYRYFYYYLYPNSNISISACTAVSDTILTLYVLKGTSNFNSRNPDNSFYTHSFTKLCSSKYNAEVNITITNNDYWYFVFHNPADTDQVFDFQLYFAQFQYNTNILDNVTQTCTTSHRTSPSDDCKLDVTHSRNYALIVTTLPRNLTSSSGWQEKVYVDFKCNRNHGGLFLVFGVPSIIIFVLVVVIISACCKLFCKLYSRYSALQTNSHASSATAHSATHNSDKSDDEETTEEWSAVMVTNRTEPPPPPYIDNCPPSYSETYL